MQRSSSSSSSSSSSTVHSVVQAACAYCGCSNSCRILNKSLYFHTAVKVTRPPPQGVVGNYYFYYCTW